MGAAALSVAAIVRGRMIDGTMGAERRDATAGTNVKMVEPTMGWCGVVVDMEHGRTQHRD
jgi:hypothetical protein